MGIVMFLGIDSFVYYNTTFVTAAAATTYIFYVVWICFERSDFRKSLKEKIPGRKMW